MEIVFGLGADYVKPDRSQKGKSLLESRQNFTAIDLETTGLSPEYDSIIELGAVRYRDGEETERFQSLINPGFELDEFITELTGITDDMLAGASTIEQMLPSFLAFLGNDVLVGHNVNFDINFLYDEAKRMGQTPVGNDFIDTMRISRRLHRDWPNHKLDTMADQLGCGIRDLHRAADDAAMTASCYLALIQDPDFDEKTKPTPKQRYTVTDLTAEEGSQDENSPLYGKLCVFTGTLESFTRRDAAQLVLNIGGTVGDSISKKTNFLILGNNDYCSTIKDGKSRKQKKAEQLILSGADLQIIPESVFLEMIQADS